MIGVGDEATLGHLAQGVLETVHKMSPPWASEGLTYGATTHFKRT